MISSNNISLKNVKHYNSKSKETPCFTASVYVNNELITNASNKGKGGATTFTNVNNKTITKELANPNNEAIIFELVLEIVSIKSRQGSKLIVKKDNNIYTINLPKTTTGKKLSIAQIKKIDNGDWLTNKVTKLTLDGYTILNSNI